MTEITMPKLSDSMEEGTILTWLKREGERVEAGDDLVEIETDKATMTHPAEAAGLLSVVAAEGDTLPVGAPIARLLETAASAPDPGPRAEPGLDVAQATQSGESALASSGVELGDGTAQPVASNGRAPGPGVKATPLARRVAQAHGVGLDDVRGSGPLGRITRADVLAKAGLAPEPSPAPAAAPAAPPAATSRTAATPAEPPAGTAKGDVEVVALTRLQTVVARRMAEAKATVPEFGVQTDVVMDAAIAFRAQFAQAGARPPSFNDLIVKAAALSLRQHPRANGSYRDGHLELHSRVNVGIAVAAPDALVVPTIFDADQKSLGAIAGEARRLAERVREGTVSPPELSGATFTVSNLGMYGMTAIAPVINVPQAAILGVGTMREVLGRVDGEVVDRHVMTLTLTCDHRILYGAEAAEFLSAIRRLLEQPVRLAL
jgi:pyruvate dehydrogenase E2 component (dihydrolipoamide acetyltransferase)